MTEPRKRREGDRPEWLKFITSLPACTHCGIVVGGCLLELMGVDKSACPKEKPKED